MIMVLLLSLILIAITKSNFVVLKIVKKYPKLNLDQKFDVLETYLRKIEAKNAAKVSLNTKDHRAPRDFFFFI